MPSRPPQAASPMHLPTARNKPPLALYQWRRRGAANLLEQLLLEPVRKAEEALRQQLRLVLVDLEQSARLLRRAAFGKRRGGAGRGGPLALARAPRRRRAAAAAALLEAFLPHLVDDIGAVEIHKLLPRQLDHRSSHLLAGGDGVLHRRHESDHLPAIVGLKLDLLALPPRRRRYGGAHDEGARLVDVVADRVEELAVAEGDLPIPVDRVVVAEDGQQLGRRLRQPPHLQPLVNRRGGVPLRARDLLLLLEPAVGACEHRAQQAVNRTARVQAGDARRQDVVTGERRRLVERGVARGDVNEDGVEAVQLSEPRHQVREDAERLEALRIARLAERARHLRLKLGQQRAPCEQPQPFAELLGVGLLERAGRTQLVLDGLHLLVHEDALEHSVERGFSELAHKRLHGRRVDCRVQLVGEHFAAGARDERIVLTPGPRAARNRAAQVRLLLRRERERSDVLLLDEELRQVALRVQVDH
mmetsp:Transcript_56910/g.130701  ORF Transcript_56910/g.130701 Transcript_56910/m.130701 type:complete len:474 (+) Transcript_56910:327-1748(+)